MGLLDRCQRLLWAIGRPFCRFPSEGLERQQRALVEEVRRLQQYQADYQRKFEAQQVVLTQMQAHQVECDQERVAMRGRLAAMNEDRLALFRLLTQVRPESPLQLLSGSE